MGLNRKVFFDRVRAKPFGGVLSQQAVGPFIRAAGSLT